MKKTLKVVGVILGIVLVFLVYVQFTFKQKFEVPVTGIKASTDSTIVAHGKYLVLGASHCYACHTNDSLRALKLKEPLMGGNVYETPFGSFNIPNITMDKETGIGNFSDEQLARAIRYNVNHDDFAMAGFMSYNNMSDEDITAIISYLRTTAPVTNHVPDHDLNILGKLIVRFLVKPHREAQPSKITPDTTAEYGKYFAYTVGQCNSCHTKRDKIGRFVGEPFAGGFEWDLPDGKYTSPNLTPHDTTGRIAHWSEDVFIQRFRTGRVLEGSPMPWEGYENISERDLKALYRYFNSLEPVKSTATVTYQPKNTASATALK
ncbi:MAG TPA: cytochrome c [Chryseosolibacter sp.]